MEQDLLPRFESYVKAHQMLNKGETVVTGFSGGADSTALLLLLLELSGTIGFSLVAVHVNHGIRGEEADTDEAFAKRFCEERDIPFFAKRIQVPAVCRQTGESEEEAARRLRYEILCSIAREKNGVVAVAHHKEDNAETVLLNLIRGSGIKGLSGIQPVNRMNGVKVIRPLLSFSRAEVEAFLDQNRIAFCLDATNEDTSYARNRLRKHVMPELARINERAAEHICESAAALSEAEAFLEKETQKALEETVSFMPEQARIRISKLQEKDPVLQKRVILHAAAQMAGSRKDLTSAHVKSVGTLVHLQSGRKVCLPYGLIARRQYDEILMEKREQNEAQPDPVSFRIRKEEIGNEWKDVLLPNGMRIAFRTVAIDAANRETMKEKNRYTKVLDYDKISTDIIVGPKASGDGIFLREGRKTVKKFFVDEKIPADRREKILLVKDETDVLWITGYRISEKHKITASTKKGLLMKLTGGDHEWEH